MQVLSYTLHYLMSSRMCFTAQPDHGKRNKGLLSCYLLHTRLHLFPGLATSVTYKLLEFTVMTQLTLLPMSTTFPILFLQILMGSVIPFAHTIYPPLPETQLDLAVTDSTSLNADFPKQIFWLLEPQPDVLHKKEKCRKHCMLPFFFTDVFLLPKLFV